MKRVGSACIAIVATVSASAAQIQARPANTLQELWPALTLCWRPPLESDGSEVTVVFSLDRDGRLVGQPTISHSRLFGREEVQRAFAASALAALAACTPAKITPELGEMIAGRLITFRFGSRPPQPSS